MGDDLTSRTGTTLFALLRDPAGPETWNAFVARYGPKILAWCHGWGLQQADAEDVTQEVVTKLYQQLHTFISDAHKGRFRAWLHTVTRRVWCDFHEGRRRAGWGSGDPHIQQLLDNQAEGDGLVEVLDREHQLELLDAATARVRLQV